MTVLHKTPNSLAGTGRQTYRFTIPVWRLFSVFAVVSGREAVPLGLRSRATAEFTLCHLLFAFAYLRVLRALRGEPAWIPAPFDLAQGGLRGNDKARICTTMSEQLEILSRQFGNGDASQGSTKG